MTVIKESKRKPRKPRKLYEVQAQRRDAVGVWLAGWFKISHRRTKFGAYASFWYNELFTGDIYIHRIVDKGVSDVD